MEEFKALSLSYKHSPIEVREQVAFHSEESADFLLKAKESFDVDELLLVSTCNRTELYYSSKEKLDDELIKFLASFKALDSRSLASHFSSLDHQSATSHLFRVALGLDSKVLGDIQIANQIKRAYQQSTDLNLSGPFLHRLMHTIFYANKRVVQETRLQDGTASVASVAVEMIKSFLAKIRNPRIALVGLGEIGQNVLENLGVIESQITLVNRTRATAEKLATHPSIVVRDYADLADVINENDVVISSVSSGELIIEKQHLRGDHLHKFFIDLSVPRSIDPSTEEIPGVSLTNIDQLSERTQKAKSMRAKAIPQAESIIQESLNGFSKWKSEMEISPTIQKLKLALDQIRKEEIARQTRLSDRERDLIEVVTKNMIQKVIKLPVIQLKAACKRGEAETLVEVLNDLFNLEQQEPQKK